MEREKEFINEVQKLVLETLVRNNKFNEMESSLLKFSHIILNPNITFHELCEFIKNNPIECKKLGVFIPWIFNSFKDVLEDENILYNKSSMDAPHHTRKCLVVCDGMVDYIRVDGENVCVALNYAKVILTEFATCYSFYNSVIFALDNSTCHAYEYSMIWGLMRGNIYLNSADTKCYAFARTLITMSDGATCVKFGDGVMIVDSEYGIITEEKIDIKETHYTVMALVAIIMTNNKLWSLPLLAWFIAIIKGVDKYIANAIEVMEWTPKTDFPRYINVEGGNYLIEAEGYGLCVARYADKAVILYDTIKQEVVTQYVSEQK